MKKILLFLTSIILLSLAGIYIIIPGKVRINSSLTMEANKDALLRKLSTSSTWSEWWPGEKKTNDSSFSYILNRFEFIPGHSKILSVPVSLQSGALSAASELTFFLINTDSTEIHFETQVPTSLNPLKRLRVYQKSKTLKNSFSTILQSINKTYSSVAHLYGYDIQKKSVVDSTLVFTAENVKGRPTIDKIYSLIDKLKSYIQKNSAMETGFPMLNIYTADSIDYLVKVAIPVNKKLPDTKEIYYRWMLGGGNILITEVKGGQPEINKAYEQILHYITDYQRTAPAIPFESLVTDRRKEPDSSKWITRIYYPVM